MTASPKAKVLALLPKFTGCLSMVGSLMIVYDIWKERRQQQQPKDCRASGGVDKTFHRIMAGLSCMDVLCSICNVLSTWPTPSYLSDVIWLASGTTQTCTAQGFFAELGNVGAVLYSASLSIHYVSKIRSSSSLRKSTSGLPIWQEIWMHAIPIFTAIAMAVVGLPLNLYNNSGWLCWYSPYPRGCDPDATSGDKVCTRGSLAGTFRWVHYAIVWGAILTVTVCMCIIFSVVRRFENRANKRLRRSLYFNSPSSAIKSLNSTEQAGEKQTDTEQAASGANGEQVQPQTSTDNEEGSSRFSSFDPSSSAVNSSTNTSSTQTKLKTSNARTKRVATQACLYICGLYLTWIFTTLTRIFQTVQGQNHFELLVLMAFFFPLQGFFNALIYFRSKYGSFGICFRICCGVNRRSGKSSQRPSSGDKRPFSNDKPNSQTNNRFSNTAPSSIIEVGGSSTRPADGGTSGEVVATAGEGDDVPEFIKTLIVENAIEMISNPCLCWNHTGWP